MTRLRPDARTIAHTLALSTCQKRATACVLYDALGNMLACESNQCSPDGGRCTRLGVTNTKADYPTESCNWVHAERRAINALPSGSLPHRAVLYGHDFYCDACESALRAAGVTVFEVEPL